MDKALSMIGDSAIILQNSDAGFQDLSFIFPIIHGAKGISVIGYGIGHHDHIFHVLTDFGKPLKHPVITDDIGRMKNVPPLRPVSSAPSSHSRPPALWPGSAWDWKAVRYG